MDIYELIADAREGNASDIIITDTGKAAYRVCDNLSTCKEIVSIDDLTKFIDKHNLDCANRTDYTKTIWIDNIIYRVSVFKINNKLNLIIRIPKTELDPVKDLGIQVPMSKIAVKTPGITIISGNSNNGKSTTVAAILNAYTDYNIHIMTAEDPIEFYINNNNSIVSQRELDRDFKSYSDIINMATKESIDVLFIHEIDSFETLLNIFNAVDSGIHVITTVPTNSCELTLKKLVNMCDNGYTESWVANKLSEQIHCIISQTLVPNPSRTSRILSTEVLFNKYNDISSAIASMKYDSLDDIICKYSRDGMHTLESDLAMLVKNGKIDIKDAISHSINKTKLQKLL